MWGNIQSAVTFFNHTGQKFLPAIHLYIWCKSTKNQLEISIRHLIFRDKIC